MNKKIMTFVASTTVAAAMLAGCGQENQGAKNESTDGKATAAVQESGGEDIPQILAGDGEVETIKMYCMNMGVASDYENVEAAINEISVPEIGVQLDLTMLDIGQWFEQYAMLISGSESVDLMPSFTDAMVGGINQGAFTDLTELYAQYGTDIPKYVPEKYLAAGTFNGALYGIPSANMYANAPVIEYDADLVKELGIDVSGVKSLEDWEGVMAQVQAARPDVIPFTPNGGNTVSMFNMYDWDAIGNNKYGVLMLAEDTNHTTVTNVYASDEYRELCKLMESWNQKGYIAKDAITETDTFISLCKAGKAFSTLASENIHEVYVQKESTNAGKNIDTIRLCEPFSYNSMISIMWSIPVTSEHPEAAMKFLNLMYSNKDVATLFAYGQEGVNYQVLEDGTIDFVEGESMDNCKYHPSIDWVLPNQYHTLTWKGNIPVTIEESNAFNESAIVSPALGFTFDSSSVTNEITACDNVVAQYTTALELGAVDVDTVLPEFIEALEKANVNKIIEEKQAQLDAWLSQK